MIIAAIIIGLILFFIIIICTAPKVKKTFNFDDGMCAGICFSLFFVIEVGIVGNIISEPTHTAMDVYQGKTTLEYKVVDDVKVDSVVIFKNDTTGLNIY